MSKFYFIYVLLSEKDGMFYTGFTRDIHNRVSQHSAGYVQSTRDRRPMKLIYFEGCLSQTDAINRERYLKSGMGKRYIRNRIKNFFVESVPKNPKGYYYPDKSRKPAKK